MARSRRVAKYIKEAQHPSSEGRGPDGSGSGSGGVKLRKKPLFLMGFLAFLTLTVGLCLGTYNFLQYRFVKSGPSVSEITFAVPKGSGSSAIAARLDKEGLISNASLFKLLVKMEDGETGLKAGEYNIPAGASMRDIFNILESGQAVLYPFTVAEGLTSAQVMRAMERIETLVDDSPAIPPEGSLLPETYMTPRGMTQSELVRNMQRAQKEVLDELWPGRDEGLPFTTRAEAIILASVVEKETGIAGERDMVAGVFVNRLKKNMRLQSDPTIIYGETGGEPLGRGIRRSEINRKTDWNTYQIDGLPKTPICNPGRGAIAAVLNPGQTEALFFVADGTGGHVFSKTLAGHEKNVKNWRQVEQRRKREAAAAAKNNP